MAHLCQLNSTRFVTSSDQPIVRALDRLWPTGEAHIDVEMGNDATEAERRTSVRRDGCADVSVAGAPPFPLLGHGEHCDWLHEHGMAGRLIDLSITGASMVLPKSFESESAIFVRLAPYDDCHPVDVPARVVRSVELADGQWKVVAQFDQHLCFDQAYVMTQPAVM